jgi:hypothetical protein
MKHLKKHFVTEELDRSTYRSAMKLGKERGDDKGKSISKTALELLARSIGKELAGKTFIVKPVDKDKFQDRMDSIRTGGRESEKPPITGQYKIEFGDYCTVHGSKGMPSSEDDDLLLVIKANVKNASEFGGWSKPVKITGYDKFGTDSYFILAIRGGDVSVYTYNWETKLQFDRKDAREIANIARMAWEGMTGDPGENIRHNRIHQFDLYKNQEEE